MPKYERTVPVRKAAVVIKAGERIRFTQSDRLARTAKEDETEGVVGLAAADAAKDAFTVDVRIPVAQPGDLLAVQCLDTGRRTADDRPIVEPFLVKRRFGRDDDPDRDRHPVEFLAARDALNGKADSGKPAKKSAEK